MNGNPFMGSRGECTSDTVKEILRPGTQVQFLSNNDPEHSHARQQQEPLNTNSSKILLGNMKYRGFHIQDLGL